MTENERIDGLLRAARLELKDEERARLCDALDDLSRLCRELDGVTPDTDISHTIELEKMREDKACVSSTLPNDILKLSEGTNNKYIAVPITVDQQ